MRRHALYHLLGPFPAVVGKRLKQIQKMLGGDRLAEMLDSHGWIETSVGDSFVHRKYRCSWMPLQFTFCAVLSDGLSVDW